MALGRGLASLIPKKENKFADLAKEDFASSGLSRESVFYVEIEKIKPNPHQPRKNFAEEALRELADSIKEYGIIQPLVVSKVERITASGKSVEYELIAGERRLRAAEIVGINQIPVVIRKASEEEKLALALIENIQRDDLNAIEKANAFKELVDQFNLSHQEIADKVSKSREAVSNILRLLSLPMEIQYAVSSGEISEGHARAILSMGENLEKQRAFFKEILEKKLTVREAEEMARTIKKVVLRKRIAGIDPEVRALEERLEEALGTRVRLKRRGESGRVIIEFYSREELNKFLEKVGIEDK
ncbi:MAG: ParB/RepB/Spo0J family partition protein [Patescibacteria group bacterium]